MRVYGWYGNRRGCTGLPSDQTREIVAARSMAAVARIVGCGDPRRLHCLCETGNEEETAVATAKPGVVHWRPFALNTGGWQEDAAAGIPITRQPLL